MDKITTPEYSGFEKAYDHFNKALFGNRLPRCLITLQRKGGTSGYFSANRFKQRSGSGVLTDEIALNPDSFLDATDTEIMQTLVHEMCHLWQEHFGHPSRRTYHNKEWADKMEDIGLMPSTTGKPGGNRVGQKMLDYPIEGGRFEKSCQRLFATGYRPNWQSSFIPGKAPVGEGSGVAGNHADSGTGGKVTGAGSVKSNKTKTKFTCSRCGQNAWAKPSAMLLCGVCFALDGLNLSMDAA